MKAIVGIILLFFSVSCFALPECEGSPAKGWRFASKNNWTDCRGKYSYGGREYYGSYKNGYKEGWGTQTYSNLTKYVGEWKRGKRQGKGTLTYGDGTKYQGEWNKDKMHGQGTYTYPNGETYAGSFNNYPEGESSEVFDSWVKSNLTNVTEKLKAEKRNAEKERKIAEKKRQRLAEKRKRKEQEEKVRESMYRKTLQVDSKLEVDDGFFLSSEDKCVNSLIKAWNATPVQRDGAGYYKYVPSLLEPLTRFWYMSEGTKENFLAVAWKQCRER